MENGFQLRSQLKVHVIFAINRVPLKGNISHSPDNKLGKETEVLPTNFQDEHKRNPYSLTI